MWHIRKLAIACGAFSAAIFAANYLLGRSAALYAALIFTAAGAALLAARLKILRGAIIVVFAAAAGLFVFSLHYDLTVQRAHKLAGRTEEVYFQVLDYPEDHNSYQSVNARISSHKLPDLNTLLYDSEHRLTELRPGDLVRVNVKLSPADIRYGQSTNRYSSKNVYLTATVKGEPFRIGRRSSIITLAADAAHVLSDRVDGLYDTAAAPFVRSIMLGDKSELYLDDAAYVSLSRAGFMHIVAVSGMHVAYLVGFVRFVFGKGKRSSILCIATVWAFVIISGMSPSSLRAAFMQTMLLCAPLFGRENDPITSLFTALAVLLAANPFSACSVSLQLSFAAMLGIICLADRLNEIVMLSLSGKGAAKVLRYPVGVITCSLGVMVFTVPIMAAHFGYIAILSPVTNLLCLWAAPLCFIGGYISSLLHFLPALASFTAELVSFLVRYIFIVCKAISSLSFSVAYLSAPLNTLWIALFYLTAAAMPFTGLSPRRKLLIPLCTAICSLALSTLGLRAYYSSARGYVTAIDVGQGQCVCAFSGSGTVLVDCGSISYAEYNAGDRAAAYLSSCGRDHINAVIFTHLHEDHTNGFVRLANLCRIDRVIIPENAAEGEDILYEIVHCAQLHGIEIEYISHNEARGFGLVGVNMIAPADTGDENERCMTVILTIGNNDTIITGDASAEREKELTEEFDLSGIENVVVGHHGSKYASCEEYLSEIGGTRALISVGKNNFGHPSDEVLGRLAILGYMISRTDLEGNVEIRING